MEELISFEKIHWKRIDDDKEDKVASLVKRFYGADGKDYPRFIMEIYPKYTENFSFEKARNFPPVGFKICLSFKRKIEEGWNYNDLYIPFYLYQDLIEMIEEARKK